MKVIYDISTVGNRPEARTGVARVAWTTAMLLKKKLDENISFSASGSISAALQIEDLLSQYSEFHYVGRPIDPVAKLVHRWQEESGKSATTLSLLNALLTNLSRLMNITRMPIDERALRKADLFHSPYARIPTQVRSALPERHVLTVNDLTPLILNEHLFMHGQRSVTKRMIDSVQTNDWVITISDSTRSDLCTYRSLNSERVTTIHLAASEEMFYPVNDNVLIQHTYQKYGIPSKPYLLTLHSLAPHKNLTTLIRSFHMAIEQERINDLTLVVCGGQGRPLDATLNSLNLTQRDLKQVIFTGYVEDEDLAAIYSGALAFVFPSLYEGFGLPVLEAMQCGCPVITSNTSSLPEIVGDAGIMVNPLDRSALCDAMITLYRDNAFAQEASRRSKKRASLFSWEKAIDETLHVYERMQREI